MQPQFTSEQVAELRRLLNIMKNEDNLPGDRRIAMAQFDRIYKQALKRTTNQERNREMAF